MIPVTPVCQRVALARQKSARRRVHCPKMRSPNGLARVNASRAPRLVEVDARGGQPRYRAARHPDLPEGVIVRR